MPRGNVTFTAMWEDDVWDGTKTKKKPDQDTEGYYLISTGAELAYFQDKDLGKAKLMCDINLNGHPFKAIEKCQNLTVAAIPLRDLILSVEV